MGFLVLDAGMMHHSEDLGGGIELLRDSRLSFGGSLIKTQFPHRIAIFIPAAITTVGGDARVWQGSGMWSFDELHSSALHGCESNAASLRPRSR